MYNGTESNITSVCRIKASESWRQGRKRFLKWPKGDNVFFLIGKLHQCIKQKNLNPCNNLINIYLNEN